MPAGIYPLKVEQGADFTRSPVFKTADETPRDFTGCTVRMQVRALKASSSVLLTPDVEITAPGTVFIGISAAQTALLPGDGSAVYDLELVRPDGTVERLLQGSVTIDGNVTRDE